MCACRFHLIGIVAGGRANKTLPDGRVHQGIRSIASLALRVPPAVSLCSTLLSGIRRLVSITCGVARGLLAVAFLVLWLRG
jgi:hypothetical protein